MLKYLFFCIVFCAGGTVPLDAQNKDPIKDPAIGIHFVLDDFKTADYIRDHSLGAAFGNHQFARKENLKSGLAVNYLQGITKHLDFSVTLTGSYLDYSLHNDTMLGHGSLLLESDGVIIAKLFSDRKAVLPFLSGGVTFSKYTNYFGILFPFGPGLQVNLANQAFILLNAQYRTAITANVNSHFYYSIGLAGNIFNKHRKKIQPVPTILPPKNYDKDKDGIPDSIDRCPDVPGLQQYQGCPDSDGDGIPDDEDKCPHVAGALKYHGCPVPDTDGDGIDDDHDSCITVPGVLKYHGCPVPDTDGDGVNDEEDKCPAMPGTKENHGCPAIKKEITEQIQLDAGKIYFATGSYRLLPQSFSALDDVIKILVDHPELKVMIEGHTDNTGGEQMNLTLSENRAHAVLNYIAIKGSIDISRLSAKGYGLTRPLADNKTAKGRALNRRVELKLAY